jgi:hypothetical protein
VITPLTPGRYFLRAFAMGFAIAALCDMGLSFGDRLTFDGELESTAVAEAVALNVEALAVSREGLVGTVIDREFVENLPLNGRSLHALLELTPGVVLVRITQFCVNGQHTTSNYMTIDGVSANTCVITATSIVALQEPRIRTSSYAPESGRTPDGQVWTYVQPLVLIAELLLLAGLLILLFMSHIIRLTKWALEEYDDFRKWWDEFKGRRR